MNFFERKTYSLVLTKFACMNPWEDADRKRSIDLTNFCADDYGDRMHIIHEAGLVFTWLHIPVM
jgi:hypothetical protein